MLALDTARRIEQVLAGLHAEFPDAPLETIKHDVDERVHELALTARFDDYVPLLARRTVRERLLAMN